MGWGMCDVNMDSAGKPEQLNLVPLSAENSFNATLFVGGLTDAASEEDLWGMFGLFGDLVSVKCLAAKGCAFVQYQTAAAAKAAMTMLQDQVTPPPRGGGQRTHLHRPTTTSALSVMFLWDFFFFWRERR